MGVPADDFDPVVVFERDAVRFAAVLDFLIEDAQVPGHPAVAGRFAVGKAQNKGGAGRFGSEGPLQDDRFLLGVSGPAFRARAASVPTLPRLAVAIPQAAHALRIRARMGAVARVFHNRSPQGLVCSLLFPRIQLYLLFAVPRERREPGGEHEEQVVTPKYTGPYREVGFH